MTSHKFLEITFRMEVGGSDPCLYDSQLTYDTLHQGLPGCPPELADDGSESHEPVLIECKLPLSPPQPIHIQA